MCFSANASFATAGALTVIGLLSIRTARHNKKLIPLAASPLFFAVQQTCEGLVWITLNNGDTTSLLHSVSTYGFLFFASAWWPFWIPLTFALAEKIPHRKKILLFKTIIGSITATILFISWAMYTSGAEIIDHHITYPVSNYPFGITNAYVAQAVAWPIAIFYCLSTITPFFISSIPYAWILGIIIGIGLVASYLFYIIALPSVWCFFAAASSVLLYFIIRKNK